MKPLKGPHQCPTGFKRTYAYWLWDNKPCPTQCDCLGGECAYCCDIKTCNRKIAHSAEVEQWLKKEQVQNQLKSLTAREKKVLVALFLVLYVVFVISYICLCGPKKRGEVYDELPQETASLRHSYTKYNGSCAIEPEQETPEESWGSCSTFLSALEFLDQMQSAKPPFDFHHYLDAAYNKCYCAKCYHPDWADTVVQENAELKDYPYIIPRGWSRVGLQVPSRAKAEDAFGKWCISFHGTFPIALKSILRQADLCIPGDKLMDGTLLKSKNCAGRQDKVYYTSPTIKYAGLQMYAAPTPFTDKRGREMACQVVLQCKQKPASFQKRGETMRFDKWPGYTICEHIDRDEVEWYSDRRGCIIPYGILLRVFPKDQPPDKYFRSPSDR
jgi:hypothetical protein